MLFFLSSSIVYVHYVLHVSRLLPEGLQCIPYLGSLSKAAQKKKTIIFANKTFQHELWVPDWHHELVSTTIWSQDQKYKYTFQGPEMERRSPQHFPWFFGMYYPSFPLFQNDILNCFSMVCLGFKTPGSFLILVRWPVFCKWNQREIFIIDCFLNNCCIYVSCKRMVPTCTVIEQPRV